MKLPLNEMGKLWVEKVSLGGKIISLVSDMLNLRCL